MKKSLLLLASLVMSATSFAQWSAPTPSKTQEMATDGSAQFLYNKAAGGFFAGGNDWGTRASVKAEADSIKFDLVDADLYNFCCYPATKNKWLYVSCNNYNAMWVDAPSSATSTDYPGTDSWKISKQANGSYKISNDLYEGTFGRAEIYRGAKGDTRLYINDGDDQYDVDGEDLPSISGNFYDEWYFIDSVEYKALQPQVEVYLAALALEAKIYKIKQTDESYNLAALNAVYDNTSSTKEELDEATAVAQAVLDFYTAYNDALETYPDLDYSAPKAVYDNNKSTKEELEEAQAKIQEIINTYLATQASFDDPIDFTETIGDGSSFSPWTREFTGSGTTGDTATNTWSVEADNGADGTDMVTPFCQVWVASGGLLSEQKISQVLKGAAPGLYMFEANVRLYNEKGDQTALTGCTMYFGDETVDLSSQVQMYKSGNKCVLWNPNKFHIIAIVKEGGNIEFGFDIKEPTFNWIAFKETSLRYYGNENVEENAALLSKAVYNFEKYEEGDIDANPELIEAYNNAVDAFNSAVEPKDVVAAATEVGTAKKALEANAAAYKNLLNEIDNWDKAISEKEGLEGAEWSDFSDFVQSEEEVEGYPTPNPVLIIQGDRSLTTEEINDYISTVSKLYAEAIAKSIVPGADCTDMIVNAGFTDPNKKGWTIATGGVNLFGGLIPSDENPKAGFPVAECWCQKFDVYQIVEGVQDGIYSLSLNGFCRHDQASQEYIPAEIYMNEFSTPLTDIYEGGIPEEEGIDGFNCYLTNGANSAALTQNELFIGGTHQSPNDAVDKNVDGKLSPNGMEGASVAFSAGRYEAKVYGLVEGGKMRLGIRNLKSAASWALWSNFKLTYVGKDAEALASILPTYVEKLDTYVEENQDNMTTPEVESAKKVIADAEAAEKTGEADPLYEALIAVNAAIKSASENYDAVNAFINEQTNLLDVVDSHEDGDMSAYNAIAEKITDYTPYTTAELLDLIEEMKDAAAKVKIPANIKEATDESPVELTDIIINADFQANSAGEQATGWTLVKGEGASGNYQVQNGMNDGVSMEFWSPTHGEGTKYDFYQDIKNLPAGTYEITASATNSLNEQTAGEGEGAAYIYAAGVKGDVVRGVLSDPVTVQTESCTTGAQTYTVVINLKEGETLRIGSKNIGQLSARWVMIDDFTLTYYGTGSAKEESEADTTDIVNVKSAATATAIYSVSGAQVNSMKKGLNIVKMSDGSVRKVLVK